MALGQRQFRTSVRQHFPQNLQCRTEFFRAREFTADGCDIPCMPRAHETPRLLALTFGEARLDKHTSARLTQTMSSISLATNPAMSDWLFKRARENLGLHDEPNTNSRVAALLIVRIADRASKATKTSPPDANALAAYGKIAGALAGHITVTDDAVALLETKAAEHKKDELLYSIKHSVALGLPTETAKSVLDATKGDEKRLNTYILQALGARVGSAQQKAKPAQAPAQPE